MTFFQLYFINNFMRICLVLTLVVLVSCDSRFNNSSNNGIRFSFENALIYKLEGTKIEVNDLVQPRHLLLLDSALVVSEWMGDTTFFVLDKFDFSLRKKIGIPGQGPGELGRINGINYASESGNHFWAYGAETKVLSLMEVNSTYPSKQFRQDEKTFLAIKLFPSKDNTLIAMEVDGDPEFVEYSWEGEKLNTFGGIDKLVSDDVPLSIKHNLTSGRYFHSSRKLDKFVESGNTIDLIRILDLNKKDIIRINGPINFKPNYEVDYSAGYPMLLRMGQDNIYCYLYSYLGEDFFYFLWSGKTMQQIRGFQEAVANQIFVFNTKGEFQFEYLLDIPITAFVVDEDRHQIIGVADDGSSNLVVFDLPKD